MVEALVGVIGLGGKRFYHSKISTIYAGIGGRVINAIMSLILLILLIYKNCPLMIQQKTVDFYNYKGLYTYSLIELIFYL